MDVKPGSTSAGQTGLEPPFRLLLVCIFVYVHDKGVPNRTLRDAVTNMCRSVTEK